MSESPYITSARAAELLCKPTLHALHVFIRRHPSIEACICRVGRRVLFDEQALRAWMKDPQRLRADITTLRLASRRKAS